MRHSFRVRLTVFSVVICGCVLALFALAAWGESYRRGLHQLDRDLMESVGPHLLVSHEAPYWAWTYPGLRLRWSSEQVSGCWLLVKGGDGSVLFQSEDWPDGLAPDAFGAPSTPSPATAPPPAAGQTEAPGTEPAPQRPPGWRFLRLAPPVLSTVRAQGRLWRVCVQHNDEVTLALGVSLSRLQAEMARLTSAFLVAFPLALAAIGFGGWFASGRALRSIETVAQVTEQVTARSLDQRIPPEQVETEFRRLVGLFNGMLDRLERSFDQAVRFSADAAHEFRTPLTVLQGQLEQALQRAPAGSEQQAIYTGLLEEVVHLKSIAQKLLLLSQADAGHLPLALEPTNLTALVEQTAEDTQALAPELAVTASVISETWTVADPELLWQALANLTSNAAKYNREGGAVELQLSAREEWADLAVTNTGPGIPEAQRGRLFERFYRADPARGRRTDGVGLGLSLAREIARAHGGDLVLQESEGDRTTFVLSLRLAPNPHHL